MTIAELRTLLPAGGPLVLDTLGGLSKFEVLRLETSQLAIRSSGGHMFELTQPLLVKVERRIQEVRGSRDVFPYNHGATPERWDLSDEPAKLFMPYFAALRFYAAVIAGALGYLLSPMDLIPDFIPGLGLVDDAGVIGACLKIVRPQLERYKAARRS